jgi:hypothetical protein
MNYLLKPVSNEKISAIVTDETVLEDLRGLVTHILKEQAAQDALAGNETRQYKEASRVLDTTFTKLRTAFIQPQTTQNTVSSE